MLRYTDRPQVSKFLILIPIYR